jgi:hypothetical protein
MKTIRFSVAGDYSLEEIKEIISYQESLNSKFNDSKISYQDSNVVNLVTFEQYDDATVPNELMLVKKSTQAPQNATKFWEGVMVASKELVVVEAYRAN